MLEIKKTQNKLVKSLLQHIKRSEKYIKRCTELSVYDKKMTLYYLSSVKKLGNIEKPKLTKCPEVIDTEVLIDKIIFYHREYVLYESYFSIFQKTDDIALKDYKKQLNRLVKHLRFKIRELKK